MGESFQDFGRKWGFCEYSVESQAQNDELGIIY